MTEKSHQQSQQQGQRLREEIGSNFQIAEYANNCANLARTASGQGQQTLQEEVQRATEELVRGIKNREQQQMRS